MVIPRNFRRVNIKKYIEAEQQPRQVGKAGIFSTFSTHQMHSDSFRPFLGGQNKIYV